jgi:hypothetical protein
LCRDDIGEAEKDTLKMLQTIFNKA